MDFSLQVSLFEALEETSFSKLVKNVTISETIFLRITVEFDLVRFLTINNVLPFKDS